jgi:hypothetical protein
MARRFTTNGESGMSLVGTIVAAGVATIVLAAITKNVSSLSSMQGFQERKTDRESLRLMVMNRVDCPKTFPAAGVPACVAGGQYVDLRDAAGNVVVAASGSTTIGKWTIRARCEAAGLNIRVASLSPNAGRNALNFDAVRQSGFLREPTSNLNLDWSHPKSALFASESVAPCAHRFAAPTTGSNTECSPGLVLYGYSPETGIKCKALASTDLASIGTCRSGTYLAGFDASGRVCEPLPQPTTINSTTVVTAPPTVVNNPPTIINDPPRVINTPTPPTGPTPNGGGSCTPYTSGPCRGYCGPDVGCGSTWVFSGAGQPGGCAAPSYMTAENWITNVHNERQLFGYQCYRP